MHTDLYFVTTTNGANIDPKGVQKLSFHIGRFNGNIEDIPDDHSEKIKQYPFFDAQIQDLNIIDVSLALKDQEFENAGLVKEKEMVFESLKTLALSATGLISMLQMENYKAFSGETSITEVIEVFAINKTFVFGYVIFDEDKKKNGVMDLQKQLKSGNNNTRSIN